MQRRKSIKSIYTIGYQGTDIDIFIDTLKFFEILVLADIRAVPISLKKGIFKNSAQKPT
jgi:uncharacterized protein (DUF488 family)